MRKYIFAACLFTLLTTVCFAGTADIKHFVVKENPFAQNEIAIVATDTTDHIQENVNGRFSFSINGLEENLHFTNGTAFYRHKLDKSTFLYVKHEGESGSNSVLYYVYKTDSKLIPVHISWVILLAIPVILILLGYMFKKFIIFAVIIFVLFLYFNHHNGLGIPTFFESIIDGLKSLFK